MKKLIVIAVLAAAFFTIAGMTYQGNTVEVEPARACADSAGC